MRHREAVTCPGLHSSLRFEARPSDSRGHTLLTHVLDPEVYQFFFFFFFFKFGEHPLNKPTAYLDLQRVLSQDGLRDWSECCWQGTAGKP